MKILVLLIADGEYIQGANIVINSFKKSYQGYISGIFHKLDLTIGWLDDKYNYCLQDGYRPNITDIRINHYTGQKLWRM